MKFTPNGLQLVSGARKDHRLLVWDIRYYRRPLNILSRVVKTNQRVYFDVSPCGKYLISGGTDGILRVWNVDKADWKSEIDVGGKVVDNSILKVSEVAPNSNCTKLLIFYVNMSFCKLLSYYLVLTDC